jgi:hypothetical protein
MQRRDNSTDIPVVVVTPDRDRSTVAEALRNLRTVDRAYR